MIETTKFNNEENHRGKLGNLNMLHIQPYIKVLCLFYNKNTLR